MNDRIIIQDLEVFYRVGVSDAERAQEQRLLLCVEMETDMRKAAASDDLKATINYFAVTQRLLKLGQGRSWKLIETLASEIAGIVLKEFRARVVTVTVKKFIIPQAQYVAVSLTRKRKS